MSTTASQGKKQKLLEPSDVSPGDLDSHPRLGEEIHGENPEPSPVPSDSMAAAGGRGRARSFVRVGGKGRLLSARWVQGRQEELEPLEGSHR